MTSSLPPEVRDAFERFVTTEYTTVDAGKQPITWPVTPYYRQGGPTIDVTTGLGYPKKADDAQRHPSVALLFSDPDRLRDRERAPGARAGNGRGGRARPGCQPRALPPRVAARSCPATKKMHPPKPMRAMFNWYYARIYVKVRPERVFVWPRGTSRPSR